MLDIILPSSLTLFGALPGVDLVDIISTAGWLAVIAVIFAESGLLIGFFLPGDSLLFTSGFLVYSGVFTVNIHLFVFLLFLAAVIGDNVGYTFGRRVGSRLFGRPNSRFFKQENIAVAQKFYEKHGGKTIIIARFIPFVRTFAPIIAGVGKMDYRKFLLYNLIGGFVWAFGITYAGYYLGALFTHIGLDIDHILLPVVAIIIIVSLIPPLVHILRDTKQRDMLLALSKKQFDTIFRRKR
ncbi:MAG: VTT domain-containing protein [Candidatus Saccharimonadales bacterium]